MRQERISRYECPRVTIPNGGTAAVSSSALRLNGIIRQISVTVNDNTGNKTATAAIVDEDSITLWSEAGIAEAATTVFQYWTLSSTDLPLAVCVDGNITIKVTPSGDPGTSTMTVDVVLYIDGR